ncbi:MAG TPA: hypothetical protein PKE29_00950 [Phycisphaerales bacterium]|nr:hypothetical protein [Phycisphaerales bacterium]
MKLRTLIGLVLLLAGTAVVLYGLGAAIMELVHLYGSALSDPMADTPGVGAERGVSDRMIRDVIIGAIGVPPMVIGSVMLGMGLFGLMRRLLSPMAAPAGKKKARA